MAVLRNLVRWNPTNGTLQFLDRVMVAFALDPADVRRMLGRPCRTDATSRTWDYVAECGLRLRFVAHDIGDGIDYVSIYSDRPEISHILRHVCISGDPDWRADDAPDFTARVGKATPIWAVWRYDRGAAAATLVARHASERDAVCHTRMLRIDGAEQVWMGASAPDAGTATAPASSSHTSAGATAPADFGLSRRRGA